MTDQPATSSELMRLTAEIVSAHVGNNPVPAELLPRLIEVVHQALRDAGASGAASGGVSPAVPINRSVFPDHLVCLEDGKEVVMLKRHLQTAHGMTPERYRERWNLPPHYPMVAPDYAERRSALAISSGLGRKPTAVTESGEPESRAKPGARRRPKPAPAERAGAD